MGEGNKSNLQVGNEVVSDHVISGMMSSLLDQAQDKPVELTVNNHAGQPFSVVTEPTGRVAWGVGGGKATAKASKVADPALNGAVRNAIDQAKGKPIALTVNNHAGQPFSVVTEPTGRVAWGVGGGKATAAR